MAVHDQVRRDPLHQPGSPRTHWTTDNVGEALPGVATPLGWTIWESGSDQMCRDLSFALGVFTRAERDGPAPNADPIIQVFYGRIAMCMEWLALVGDRMPGTSGPETVAGMLGRVPDTIAFAPTRARYASIATRLPVVAWRSPARIKALAATTEAWWRTEVTSLPSADEARARAALGEGAARFRHTMTVHGTGLFASVAPLTQAVAKLVERTGVGDVGALSGTGGAEMAIVEDIWRASRGRCTLDEVVAAHGYHGPLEGEISSRVWREDPTPLARMIDAYAGRDDDEDPGLRDAEARARLPHLHAELLAALPAVQRPAARTLLRYAANTLPMRGLGKASFLQALDVSRAAARRLGELHAAAGRLHEDGDVFYLTLGELLGAFPPDAAELITERRATRARYETLQLPASWRGTPTPTDAAPTELRVGDVVTGIAASAGIVEGTVRVVEDPSFADVEPGEILVSRTTDPSWASIMFVSEALVVDIGGLISHAAVVARELGIPCVVNTRTGSRDLHDGDRVRVDGAAGTVTLLART